MTAKAQGGWYPDPRAGGDNQHLTSALTTMNDRLYALEDTQGGTKPVNAQAKVASASPSLMVAALGTSLGPQQPPATSSAPGVPGQVTFDDSHLYLCITPGLWKRVNLSTF